MSPVRVSRAGYVLVGGRSSRMGEDKALLPFRGLTLGRYVADTPTAEAAEASDADTLTPAGPSGRPEPLCAVYQQRTLTRFDHVFARRERNISLALPVVHTVILSVEETGRFENVNTPADWAAYVRP